MIPLRLCQNVLDFEIQAAKVLSNRSYTYFHSAADSLQSFKANLQDWNKIRFRPRVLRNVAKVDMNARIMGQHCRLPFFISPMAMIKLADDEGELAFARAATAKQIPYAVSTYASCTLDDIAGCVRNEKLNMPMFQLYVPKDRNSCIRLLRTCRKLGFKALLVTVDTPVVGKREEDDRYKAQIDLEAGIPTPPTAVADVTEDSEEPPILRSFHSSTLSWDDLTWIREAWQNAGPIYLKGIQCAEDAVLAAQAGVDGIYLSNHGGRQLDHAPSALQTLLEIHRFCPQILDKLEIYLDGGVRRGSDIIKAICLGARGVGLGRPFVYALGAYKREGVLRAIECECFLFFQFLMTISKLVKHAADGCFIPIVLSDELETAMRLLGVNRLSELNVHYVNTKELERDIVGSIRTDQSPRARL